MSLKKIRIITADMLFLISLIIIFLNTYDIDKHLSLYVLALELVLVAVMLVRSGKAK